MSAQCQACQRITHQLSARGLCPACEDKGENSDYRECYNKREESNMAELPPFVSRAPKACEVCDSTLDVMYYRATEQDLCVDCRADQRLGMKEREKP